MGDKMYFSSPRMSVEDYEMQYINRCFYSIFYRKFL